MVWKIRGRYLGDYQRPSAMDQEGAYPGAEINRGGRPACRRQRAHGAGRSVEVVPDPEPEPPNAAKPRPACRVDAPVFPGSRTRSRPGVDGGEEDVLQPGVLPSMRRPQPLLGQFNNGRNSSSRSRKVGPGPWAPRHRPRPEDPVSASTASSSLHSHAPPAIASVAGSVRSNPLVSPPPWVRSHHSWRDGPTPAASSRRPRTMWMVERVGVGLAASTASLNAPVAEVGNPRRLDQRRM